MAEIGRNNSIEDNNFQKIISIMQNYVVESKIYYVKSSMREG